MSQPQHCPSCETEYVAGVAACADCGGPLSPGPLEHLAAAARPPAPAAPADPCDAVLATLPGMQAHHAAQALLMEKLPCTLECEGLVKAYQPDSPPREPLAVTLPVIVRVRAADLDSAREIVDSMAAEDLIGEQWNDAPPDDAAENGDPADAPTAAGDERADPEPLQPERTSMLTAVVVVAVVVGLLFLFGR